MILMKAQEAVPTPLIRRIQDIEIPIIFLFILAPGAQVLMYKTRPLRRRKWYESVMKMYYIKR